MASVVHPCCVRILAVCMTAQVLVSVSMLVSFHAGHVCSSVALLGRHLLAQVCNLSWQNAVALLCSLAHHGII